MKYLLISDNEEFNKIWSDVRDYKTKHRIPMNALIFKSLKYYLDYENNKEDFNLSKILERLEVLEQKTITKEDSPLNNKSSDTFTHKDTKPHNKSNTSETKQGLLDKIQDLKASKTIKNICEQAGVEFIEKKSLGKYSFDSLEKILDNLKGEILNNEN